MKDVGYEKKTVSMLIRTEVRKIEDANPSCWQLAAKIRTLIHGFERVEEQPIGSGPNDFASQAEKDIAIYNAMWIIRRLHTFYKNKECGSSLDALLTGICT